MLTLVRFNGRWQLAKNKSQSVTVEFKRACEYKRLTWEWPVWRIVEAFNGLRKLNYLQESVINGGNL